MKQRVICLHGLGQSAFALRYMRHKLHQAGYSTWATSYKTQYASSIEEIATAIGDKIEDEISLEERQAGLYALVHSMGGIILRYLADRFDWKRSIMLSTPNQGSKLAKHLHDRWFFNHGFGKVGQELGRPLNWPNPPHPTALIVGTKEQSLFSPTSWISERLNVFSENEKHDGTVSKNEMIHPSLDKTIEINASHTGMLWSKETATLVIRYFDRGKFE